MALRARYGVKKDGKWPPQVEGKSARYYGDLHADCDVGTEAVTAGIYPCLDRKRSGS